MWPWREAVGCGRKGPPHTERTWDQRPGAGAGAELSHFGSRLFPGFPKQQQDRCVCGGQLCRACAFGVWDPAAVRRIKPHRPLWVGGPAIAPPPEAAGQRHSQEGGGSRLRQLPGSGLGCLGPSVWGFRRALSTAALGKGVAERQPCRDGRAGARPGHTWLPHVAPSLCTRSPCSGRGRARQACV